jgi:hypothetical protein
MLFLFIMFQGIHTPVNAGQNLGILDMTPAVPAAMNLGICSCTSKDKKGSFTLYVSLK